MNEKVDPTEIKSCLDLLHGGRLFEVRAISSAGKIHFGYFDDTQIAAELVSQFANRNDYEGIYTTLNELHPGLICRMPNRFSLATGRSCTTSDGDIVRRRGYLIDVDANRPSGISSDEAELFASRTIRDLLSDWFRVNWDGLLVKCCSGNGSHLLIEATDDADKDDVKSFLEHICDIAIPSSDFDDLLNRVKVDTSVFNLARITKLYGTYARKGFSTKERPHRRSYIEGVINDNWRSTSDDRIDCEDGETRTPECSEIPREPWAWLSNH